jgi:hypothetical protein
MAFTFQILHTFAASPNPYCKKRAKGASGLNVTSEACEPSILINNFDEDSGDEIANPDGSVPIGVASGWEKQYPGFSQNPLLVSIPFID